MLSQVTGKNVGDVFFNFETHCKTDVCNMCYLLKRHSVCKPHLDYKVQLAKLLVIVTCHSLWWLALNMVGLDQSHIVLDWVEVTEN